MAADFGFIPNEQPGSYFISYNSEDADRVAPIVRELHESGVPVWYDQGLIPGYEWEYQIAKQIEKCSCVILFATKKLFQREKSYVRTEYYIAREKYDKRVIVVLLDKINAKDVNAYNAGWWFEISKMHCIDNADAEKIISAIGFTAEKASASANESMSACDFSKLGDEYFFGQNGKAQDYEKAVKNYNNAANDGLAQAQYNLGYCYEHGYGVEKDYELAVKYYLLSANQGFASAQSNLGYCYAHGLGIEKDYTKAVYYYRLAAYQGNAAARYNLGHCYYNGLGTEQDFKQAANYFRLASAQGCSVAQYHFGFCYENGQGVSRNVDEAVRLYRLAAEQGNENAKKALRRLGR